MSPEQSQIFRGVDVKTLAVTTLGTTLGLTVGGKIFSVGNESNPKVREYNSATAQAVKHLSQSREVEV